MRGSAPALALALLCCGCASSWNRYSTGLSGLYALERRLPDCSIERPHPGVLYARWTAPGPMDAHVLQIDLSRKDLYLRPILARDRIDGGKSVREPLSAMSRRTGALAALSGDYRSRGLNIAGLLIIDGRVHFAPDPPPRSSVVIGRAGKVWLGLLHPDKRPGPDYFQALGGGPLLMRSGVYQWSKEAAGRVNGEDLRVAPAPEDAPSAQAALCVTEDGRTMYWVFSESPSEDNLGMGPEELGALLTRLGCWEALRFAGGPEAGLALRGRSLAPLDRGERPIGSALGLYRVRGFGDEWRARPPAWRRRG